MHQGYCSLGAGVLGDGLGALADRVLGQFPGQQQPHCGLYLAAGDGGALVVVGEAAGLGCYALKDVVHEAVHDAHGLRRDAGVWMNLLEDFVDVDSVTFLPLALLFLVSLGDVFLGLASFLRCFPTGLRRHRASNCAVQLLVAREPLLEERKSASRSPLRDQSGSSAAPGGS